MNVQTVSVCLKIILANIIFLWCAQSNAQNIHVSAYLETKAQAEAQCAAFAASIPYGTDYCSIASSPVVVIGWISGEEDEPKYLANFYYNVTCAEDEYLDPSAGCIDKKDDECPKDGNPIVTLTGKKIQTEIDFSSNRSNLRFSRYYSSTKGWRFLFNDRELTTRTYWEASNQTFYQALIFSRSGGQSIVFKGDNTGGYSADPDVTEKAKPVFDTSSVQTGWALTLANDSTETYDLNGRLISVVSRNGETMTISYDDTLFTTTVTDINSGDVLTLQFETVNRDHLIQMTDTAGENYFYGYNTNNYLETVVYPDQTPDPLDNPVRTYHYEDANDSSLLTGITDERGVRYVTWVYDVHGRALSSEYNAPGVVDKTLFDYSDIGDPADPRVIVANALGHETAYHYNTIAHTRKVTWAERSAHTNINHPSVGCAAASQYASYDANGFKDLVVDWEGNAIDYDYDIHGREERRIEALTATVDTANNPLLIATATTMETRIITTEWHPSFRLPTRIYEPSTVTDMSYSCSDGRLINREVYAVGSEPGYAPPTCP